MTYVLIVLVFFASGGDPQAFTYPHNDQARCEAAAETAGETLAKAEGVLSVTTVCVPSSDFTRYDHQEKEN